jgi:hypothetical protein
MRLLLHKNMKLSNAKRKVTRLRLSQIDSEISALNSARSNPEPINHKNLLRGGSIIKIKFLKA